MQHFKLGLMAVLFSAVALVGCATSTETDTPVEDKSAGGAADTQPLSDRAGSKAGALKANAELLAKRRVYFEFDSSSLNGENKAIVEAHAAHLAANTQIKVRLEGNCDERGTREYNLALGERRAQAVERVMRVLGVAANRVTNVSYGEEKPACEEHNESCWRQNRRVEIVYQ